MAERCVNHRVTSDDIVWSGNEVMVFHTADNIVEQLNINFGSDVFNRDDVVGYVDDAENFNWYTVEGKFITLCHEIDEVDEEELLQQEELMRSTDVPDYLLRTEEDFLRYYWVVEMNRSILDFDIATSRSEINLHLKLLLNDLYDRVADYDLQAEDFSQSFQDFLYADAETAGQMLSLLSTDELLALYNVYSSEMRDALPETSFSLADFDGFIEDFDNHEMYHDQYSNILGDDTSYSTPQADLAEQDFLQNFFNPENSLNMIIDFILNAFLAGMNIGGYADRIRNRNSDLNMREAVREGLIEEMGGENWTLDQFSALVNRLTHEYQENRETVTDSIHIDHANEDMALLDHQVAQYEQALALDRLRAFALDPNWDTEAESQKLDQLLQATLAMPTSVLGNDVSWVQRSFIQYHNAYKQYHNWRISLKESIEVLEIEMEARKDEDENPLWWVSIVAETLLGFWDVADAIFTIRDVVMYGDWSGVPFLLFDIAVPIVGDAVMSIRNAAKGLTEMSDEMAEFLRRSDNFDNHMDGLISQLDGGDPYAFGTGSRQSRVENMINEASSVAGIDDINRYVDDVIYVDKYHEYYPLTLELDGRTSPRFGNVNGRRVILIPEELFFRTAERQFITASHELEHAIQLEFYTRTKFNGNWKAALHYLSLGGRYEATPSTKRVYDINEVIAESLAYIRTEIYFGQISLEQTMNSYDYINSYLADL